MFVEKIKFEFKFRHGFQGPLREKKNQKTSEMVIQNCDLNPSVFFLEFS